MIKTLHILLVFCSIFILSSCRESIINDEKPQSSPAKNIVINELFRIDSTKYYSHWWIELYNPTDSAIDISKWKIVFSNSAIKIDFSSQTSIFSFPAKTFLLIVSDKNKFDDYWNVAPLTTLIDFSRKFNPIKPTDEISLVDERDNIISLLRFGNFTLTANSRLKGNISFGSVPEWSSICRYADPNGAYETGNSLNDFFEEPNPIAGYYSQRMKK